MKKIILFLCFVPLIGFAQEKIDSYYNTIVNKEFDISVAELNKKGNFKYLIECESIDTRSKQAVMFVDSNKIEEFITYVKFLKETHKKWSETAISNNVKEINKLIDYKNMLVSGAFSYGDWQFSNNIFLIANFKIINDKYYVVIKNNRELISATNQFMKSDGFIIPFEKQSDFDDLIEKLNNEDSVKLLNEKKSKDDLFKN